MHFSHPFSGAFKPQASDTVSISNEITLLYCACNFLNLTLDCHLHFQVLHSHIHEYGMCEMGEMDIECS